MITKSILVLVIVLLSTGYARAGTWTTLDAPGAIHTRITGIDGSKLVGIYYDGSNYHGSLYDGTTWTTLDPPGSTQTYISDISGSNLVGSYYHYHSGYHGFLYNGTSWTNMDMPEALYLYVQGISGNNIIGYYKDASLNYHGFLYNGTTYTTLDMPEAYYTRIFGISGNNMVGFYGDYFGLTHGFLYDGATWATLDMPGATATFVYGIDGGNLVGSYTDVSGDHGFLYNGTTWTTLDMPGAASTYIQNVDGSNFVGFYYDSSGYEHGFIYTIPEPTTPPVADADGPYTIFVGDTLTLDANSSTDADDDIVSYMWDLDDDGSFETDASGQAVFDVNYIYLHSLGLLVDHTYNIHVKVTDSEGQSDVNDSTLTILPKPALEVAVDIKPGSCPNPVNVKSSGVLPIAILGTDDYDVTTIDPTSIRLSGVEPLRSSFKDVAGPVSDSNDCNCIEDGPDGFLDLTLKFVTQRIVEVVGDVNDGDVRVLTLTGVLFAPMPFETPIEGADCILIRGRHKPINRADINKDGVVNAADFAIIAENWLQSSIVQD